MKIKIVNILLMIVLLSGCSGMRKFLYDTKSTNSFSDEELKLVQYFISSPITLQLNEKISKSKITKDNKIDKKNMFYRKDIIIEKKTPGIAVKIDTNIIKVSFADDILLGFSAVEKSSKAIYQLKTFNNQIIQNNSKLVFRNKEWKIRFGRPKKWFGLFYRKNKFDKKSMPILLYKMTSQTKKKYKTEKIKGKKL